MTDNIDKIVQEAECVAAADEYFKARTWLMDTNDNRRIFEAGFDRAYALLSKLRAPVADTLPHWEEVSAKLERDETLTPLEFFIYENEPAGADAWRDQLAAALASAPVADDWTPTPENINKLPEPVRAYIHALVANSDPSGMVAENTLLRDQTKQLDAMIGRLKQALNSVGGCFDAANCEGLLEALAETNDERLKDLVERRLMYANEYARAALASAPVADEQQPSGNTGELPDAVRVPMDSLHADAGYLVGRALDHSLSRAEVVAVIRSRIDAAKIALASAPVAGEAQPVELRGVAETIKDGDGFWRSCSGCHELNEGRDTGPYSAVFKCHLGNGCSECGGIGAIWDSTDYQAMADAMARDMGQSVNAAPQASECECSRKSKAVSDSEAQL